MTERKHFRTVSVLFGVFCCLMLSHYRASSSHGGCPEGYSTIPATAAYPSDWPKACGNLTISGNDSANINSSVKYTPSGTPPFAWEVIRDDPNDKGGVTVDETGLVTIGGDACGGYTIAVTDACGVRSSTTVRINGNGGGWQDYSWEFCTDTARAHHCLCTEGRYEYNETFDHWCGCSIGESKCGCHDPLDYSCPIGFRATRKWVCPAR